MRRQWEGRRARASAPWQATRGSAIHSRHAGAARRGSQGTGAAAGAAGGRAAPPAAARLVHKVPTQQVVDHSNLHVVYCPRGEAVRCRGHHLQLQWAAGGSMGSRGEHGSPAARLATRVALTAATAPTSPSTRQCSWCSPSHRLTEHLHPAPACPPQRAHVFADEHSTTSGQRALCGGQNCDGVGVAAWECRVACKGEAEERTATPAGHEQPSEHALFYASSQRTGNHSGPTSAVASAPCPHTHRLLWLADVVT